MTVFLFDELNTQLTDQEFAKKDFLRYLRGLPADSRVAVFVLGDSLMMLHDFSQDMASLLAALEKHSDRVNPEVTAATAPPASSNSLTGDQATTAQWDSFMQSADATLYRLHRNGTRNAHCGGARNHRRTFSRAFPAGRR